MKADTFVLNDLPEILVKDWYNCYLYSEFDMQVICYYWLRHRYCGTARERIVRTQPVLKYDDGVSVKPDIVIFQKRIPLYAIELKCFFGEINFSKVRKDQEKLENLNKFGIKHAYQIVIYDSDSNFSIESRDKADWMKNYYSFIGVNLRRHPTGRLRANYEKTKRLWLHRKEYTNKRLW